ncbi:MAG TPA: TPM domain-containing protein [Paucimonas sp.]|nr:TPM domain-containing protein [Paucimonas sp.]
MATVTMNPVRCLLAMLLALLMSAAYAVEFAPIPPLTAHVTDTVGMLGANQRAALESVLQDYETRTGSQIAILLVSSTEPEAIEQYGIRVAEAWKIGRKGIDDGVILIVAKDNPKALRRLRIEAGRGVQGVLTDAKAKRILQDVIAPHFRQNDFYGGLAAGVSAIAGLLDQERFAPPKGPQAPADEFDFSDLLPFFVFFIGVLAVMSRAARARRFLGNSDWGNAAGVILGSGLGRHHRHGGFGGFGGSSGGGFSGGGGSFDGGGASGDW